MQNNPAQDAAHGIAPWHGTTILLIRKGPEVVLAGVILTRVALDRGPRVL